LTEEKLESMVWVYLGGGVESVEHVLHTQGKNFRRNTETWESGLDSNQVMSLLDRLDDSFDVEGLDGPQVDNLAFETVLFLEILGGDERLSDSAGERDNGDVLSAALNLGLSDGEDKIAALSLLGHGEGLTVQQLVLEDNDGIGIANSSLKESLGIFGTPGGDDFQTGDGTVPGRVVL